REWEVISLLAQAQSVRQIANRLDISVHTVGYHINHVMDKVGARNRVDLITMAHDLAAPARGPSATGATEDVGARHHARAPDGDTAAAIPDPGPAGHIGQRHDHEDTDTPHADDADA